MDLKMDSNTFESIPGPSSTVEHPTNLQTDEDSSRIQVDDVSNNIQKVDECVSAHGKNMKIPVKDGRLPTERKRADPLPVSQMVMEAMKSLKKRNGASVEVILQCLENRYEVDTKSAKRYVTRFMHSAVQKGILEQLSGADGELFKIKKAENVAKVGPKIRVNQKKTKADKVAKVGPKIRVNQKKTKADKVAKVEPKLKVNNQKNVKAERVVKFGLKSKIPLRKVEKSGNNVPIE